MFRGKNLIWQGILIALTAFLVLTGIDWWYYVNTRNVTVQIFGFSAGMLGFVVPVIVPLSMYMASAISKNVRLRIAAGAMIQAGILGLAISSTYKVFTGRVGLPHGASSIIDTSQIFQFGFLRGGAFQGWPSSHTSVAFAMSLALIALYPEKKWLRYIALAYALYIGVGASLSFHWLSDFVAGVILGCVIGVVVGKSFLKKYQIEKGA